MRYLIFLVLLLGLAGCDNNTPLMDKVMHEEMAAAKDLVDGGVDINARNAYGWTALMHAARVGHEDLVNLLLNHGADINAQSDDGFTALMRAAVKGHEAVVRILLKHGARIDLSDKGKATALHWAARKGHIVIVKILLDAGADPTLQDDHGQTPMMVGMAEGNNDVALMLRRAEKAWVKAHGNGSADQIN